MTIGFFIASLALNVLAAWQVNRLFGRVEELTVENSQLNSKLFDMHFNYPERVPNKVS